MHGLLKSICNKKRYGKCEVYDEVTNNVQEDEKLEEWPQEKEARVEDSSVFDDECEGEVSCAAVLVVVAIRERSMPLPLGVHLFSDRGWRLAVVGLRKSVGAVFDEAEDAVLLSFDECPMQSRKALRISGIDVGAPCQ